MTFSDKSQFSHQPALASIPQDSYELWWNTQVQSNGVKNLFNPQGRPDIVFDTRNLPGVYSCFCGTHPLPTGPVVQRDVHTDTGAVVPNRYLVTGMPRSASTAVWQIIKLLSNGGVIKTHGFKDSCPLFFKYEKVICTIRHPFDVCYSRARRDGHRGEWDAWLSAASADVLKFIKFQKFQELMNYRPDLNIFFAKYEDFWNKDLERIRHLASFLEIECSEERAQKILTETNVDRNMKKGIQSNNSDERNPGYKNSGILKNHVGSARGMPGQGVQLPQETKEKIIENCSWFFEHFGYSMEI